MVNRKCINVVDLLHGMYCMVISYIITM